jgi:DNA-binding HxlR family transcriptional regulator
MTTNEFGCGLEAVLAILGGKWKMLIVYHLATAPRRTGQLRRLVTDVSEKMLIQHLKELIEDGVVERIDFQTVPPHVEYRLTEFGQSLAEVLAPLCAWGTHHTVAVTRIVASRKPKPGEPRRVGAEASGL